ncbi:hypothetical protein [Actinomyces sp. 565]|uniref:hypothetical protein n=1 Tax=Actinomyces sp. 565 TaxID=2057794 RepID=UPI0013A6BE9E|nr:hypothetical protein [Actinomyces sp. 565]NDR52592.1 hypothetical protein [Actinomyces sp. 565]
MTRVFSRRRLLTAAGMSCGLLLAGCSRTPATTATTGAAAPTAPTAPTTAAATATTDQGSTLPFSLVGQPVTTTPIEVAQTAQAAVLSTEWGFGGDYSEIGVLPLSGAEVFGSVSANPNALMSYAAAVLTPAGPERLTPAPPAIVDPEEYFEPQDGSATDDWIVWRAATVDVESEASSVIDNWQLWAYRRTGGQEAELIGSAQELNGTTQTPTGPFEVVPTTDGTSVYWASAVAVGEAWERQVLRFALDGAEDHTVVATGDLPAAVDGGVLFAQPDAQGALTTLTQWEQATGTAQEVMSISSADSSWQVTGVWAAGNHRAVAVSSATAEAGTYIGLWNSDQQAPQTWLHTPSAIIIGSAGTARFAWGSGSNGEETGMYAVAWDGTGLIRLGEAAGYSRPALSPDGATVLLPSSDGINPVSWTVASL